MWDLSTLDPSDDADIFDGMEQVLYEPYNITTKTYYTGKMIPCLVRELRESTSGIGGTGESAIREGRFDIWTANLVDTPDGTFRPHRRDRITRYDDQNQATETWFVHEVNTSTLGTRYPLKCTEGFFLG